MTEYGARRSALDRTRGRVHQISTGPFYHTEDTALSPTWRWEVETKSQKTKKKRETKTGDRGWEKGKEKNGAPERGQRTD